jgi:hypothetical protein
MNISAAALQIKEQWSDLGIGWIIILKCILKVAREKMHWIQYRKEQIVSLCEHGDELSAP